MADMRIGENIRRLRKEKGIGQDILASQLGVTVQAVSKWETGGSMPDITLLPQIAEYFGVTMEELFYGKRETAVEDREPSESEPVELTVTAVSADDEKPTESLLELDSEKNRPQEDIDTEPDVKQEKVWEVSEPDAVQEKAWETWEEKGAPQKEPHQERPQYGWSDLENLGRTISDSVSGQIKKIRESVRGNTGFEFHFGDHWAKENEVRKDLPDDQVLRVVQFIGNKMVSADEVDDEHFIKLAVDSRKMRMDVQIYGSASITGGIGGNVTADGYVKCGNVGGNVMSEEYVECQAVGGSVTSDGDVRCGSVGGRVTSDGNVNCGMVMGTVSADGDVHCGNVSGAVRCDGNVYQTKSK